MNGLDYRKLAQALNNADNIITPRLMPWLIQHGDEAFPEHVADRIKEILMTPPRIRSGSFSASSAGGCLRAQEFGFLGFDQKVIDFQLQNIFNDGKWRHLRWQATLLTAGLVDDIEYPLVWKSKRSMGSVDAMGTVPRSHPHREWRDKSFGLELKGVSTFQFSKLKVAGPLLHHRRQVHRYFLSGGFDLFVIIYEDKTTQDVKEWVVEPDPDLIRGSERELQMLNEAVDGRKLHEPLEDCRRQRGETWHSCTYGGKFGPCLRTTRWTRA